MRKFSQILICVILSISCFGQNIDINLLRHINTNRDKSLDNSFRSITNSITPATIALPLYTITYALIKKDSASKARAVTVSSSILIAGLISTSLKYAVHRDRPFVTYSFIEKKTSGGGPSFPSGHTSSAFALATSMSIAYPKWYVIFPSFLWAGAMGYSRMDLGVHYPSDVLAGAIVGSGSALLSAKLNQWISAKHKHKRNRRPW